MIIHRDDVCDWCGRAFDDERHQVRVELEGSFVLELLFCCVNCIYAGGRASADLLEQPMKALADKVAELRALRSPPAKKGRR